MAAPEGSGGERTVVTPRLLREWPLPDLSDDGSKGDRGTVLVVGGADSTPGAVLLAGLAALRAGAGKLQVATVAQTAVPLGVALPEAAVAGLPAADDGSLSPATADDLAERGQKAAAVVIGPGLLDADGARELLRALLPQLGDTAVVLDAVALFACAGHPDVVRAAPGPVVLTPNPAELGALAEDDDLDEAAAARLVAERYDAVVVAHSVVMAPDGRCWADEAGNVGLGTSGSGDVLAGVVGGLLARGATPEQAGVLGQYCHASAGDRLAARIGRVGFLARELLDEVPLVLSGLHT